MKKHLRPRRDCCVPLLVLRGGKGAHKDEKKENNRKSCRQWKKED